MTEPDESQLLRLERIMRRLRAECPWDAKQTHHSLIRYLVEESAEVIDAIEGPQPRPGDDDSTVDDDNLVEELGDLLLQVYFHAQIAASQNRFDIEDVARGIADKLVRRHPWVFGSERDPQDLRRTWEESKRAEKHRDSVLDGIPRSLPSLARAVKISSRIRDTGLEVDLDAEPIGVDQVGTQILSIVQRAHAAGVDADQALRAAIAALEDQVYRIEALATGDGDRTGSGNQRG